MTDDMEQNDIREEIWVPCPIDGYEYYLVSNLGRVFNMKRGRMVSGCESWDGYRRFGLKSGVKRVQMLAHRLVWLTFRGEVPLTLEVDHVDGDRKNNRLDNLQLLSHRDNCRKKQSGWKKGEGKRANRPQPKHPRSNETREKLRHKMNAYWDAKRDAMKNQ